jgi:hypothetical protein
MPVRERACTVLSGTKVAMPAPVKEVEDHIAVVP